jgi:hypothetical protein
MGGAPSRQGDTRKPKPTRSRSKKIVRRLTEGSEDSPRFVKTAVGMHMLQGPPKRPSNYRQFSTHFLGVVGAAAANVAQLGSTAAAKSSCFSSSFETCANTR